MYFQDVSELIPTWSNEVEREIIAIRMERRWKKVSKDYINKLTFQFEPIETFFSCLSQCSEIVCSKKYPLTADRAISILSLFTDPQIIEFYILGHSIRKGQTSTFAVKSTPLSVPGTNGDTNEVLFEFLPKDASDFKSISSSGETIYPHQMHLRFSITGKTKIEPELKNWTPTPPLTWASGLRCHSYAREDVSLKRFTLRWREIYMNRSVPVVDKHLKAYFMLAFDLYF